MNTIKIQLAFLALLFFIAACNNQQAKFSAYASVTENKNERTMENDSLVNFAQKLRRHGAAKLLGMLLLISPKTL